MEAVANQAFIAAGLTMLDIDAVAATVKPGVMGNTIYCVAIIH